MHVLRSILSLVLTAALASGCATLRPGAKADQPVAVKAPSHLRDDARLDLEILLFDPGLPPHGEELPDDVLPGIRKAEATYLPCLLRNTLVATGQWGDVFLGPRRSSAVEAFVLAEIVESDGEDLVLEVEVIDATERRWLDKRYFTRTSEADYAGDEDPYQRMFNTIANDMVEARNRLTSSELRDIRRVAEIQFGASFSPEQFSGYTEANDDGVLQLVRLPAEDDPMLARVRQARERESMFIDTLDGHYEQFCSAMTASYLQWRGASKSEAAQYRSARNKRYAALAAIPILIGLTVLGVMAAGDTGAEIPIAVVGAAGVEQLYVRAEEWGAEADLHKGTLDQMHASFDSEVEPMIVETEESTHRLTGTIDEQYAEWRRLLRELYESEDVLLADLKAHIDRVPQETQAEDATPRVAAPPPEARP